MPTLLESWKKQHLAQCLGIIALHPACECRCEGGSGPIRYGVHEFGLDEVSTRDRSGRLTSRDVASPEYRSPRRCQDGMRGVEDKNCIMASGTIPVSEPACQFPRRFRCGPRQAQKVPCS